MYIIVEGRVRVHDGERTLDEQWAYDVFGEMALLDEDRRAASVTAIDDTRLFHLNRALFYELMTSQPEVAHGVVRVLTTYLRDSLRDMAQDFEYIQQMSRLTAAAAALEAGVYHPSSLDEVARRPDALGQLTRVFRRMAAEVTAREQRLKQEVHELRIKIDAAKRERQVTEIVETDYFRELEQKAEQLRKSLHTNEKQPPP
jgi:CRP-like cAMP-binding protein